MKYFFFCAGSLCLSVAALLGAPGDLDLTFAGTGKARVGFGFGEDRARGVAVQADGKTVVVGSSTNGILEDFSVVRYNVDGTLDPSFGVGGKVLTAIGQSADLAAAVKIQTDGRIVVAGSSSNGLNRDFAIVRYNLDGSLDTSFGAGGKVTTPISTSDESGSALAIQTDGKLVVAGSVSASDGGDFAVVRYHANGSLDDSFDADGKVVTNIRANTPDGATAIVVQADGKIVVAGASDHDIALVRYQSTGALDLAFGVGGKVITPTAVRSGLFVEGGATGLAIQPGTVNLPNKIVVVGYHHDPGNPFSPGGYRIDLCRYNLDGSLDNTFGGDGLVTTEPNHGSLIGNAVAVQVTGMQTRKILVAGTSVFEADTMAILRFDSDGSFDATFNNDGIAIVPIAENANANAMIFAAGKVVVAGIIYRVREFDVFGRDFAVARLNPDGSLDDTFSEDGITTNDVGDGEAVATGVAIQADGKTVVAGRIESTFSELDFCLARYQADGALDLSFGTEGRVTTDIAAGSADTAAAVLVQSDGKIVVAGTAAREGEFSHRFAVARYHPNGTPDTSFSSDGITTVPMNNFAEAAALAIQTDGKIIVAGFVFTGGVSFDLTVIRLNADGTPDISFSGDGKVTTPDGVGRALAIQPDGKIVVAGYTSNLDFAAFRYHEDGSPDLSFAGTGRNTYPIGSGSDIASAVAVDGAGNILLAGTSHNGTKDELVLARFTTNGSRDLSFGIVRIPIGTGDDKGSALALQTDGKILVAGSSFNTGAFANFAVVRLNPDGSLDSTYRNGGRVLIDFGSASADAAFAIALDAIGRATIAGTGDGVFGTARLLGDPFLQIRAISRTSAGMVTLQGVAVPGFLNSIQTSPDLGPSSFGFLMSVTPDATGFFEQDVAGIETKRFYRLSFP